MVTPHHSYQINQGYLSVCEVGGWRTGDATHTAGEEVTVDQLKPEYLHCRPKAFAGEASAARRRLLLYA
jgi:hypothetical protein